MDEPTAEEAPVQLDPRAEAMQNMALCEQRLRCAREDRDRVLKRVEKAEELLAEARSAAADLLGVRESELVGLR